MDSLFHFVFPMIAALAARLHIKHTVGTILVAAFLAVLIDLDHFIGIDRTTFHNIFIVFLIPLILLFLAFHFKSSLYVKGFFFLLLIFLSSHVFLDMFSSSNRDIGIIEGEGIALFYPLSDVRYAVAFNIAIPLKINSISYPVEGYIVSSLGFGILMYFLIILVPCLFIDDILDIAEINHEKFRKAAKTFFKNLLKD